MSITQLLTFTRRQWSMPQDPGRPSGHWIAAGTDEGDGTGGTFTWQHIFAQPSSGLGDPHSLYSIEQLMMTQSILAANDCLLQILNMDVGSGPLVEGGIPCLYQFDMEKDGSLNASLPAVQVNTRIWVGRFAGRPTDAGQVTVVTDNPGAADVFRVKLQGYWWSPEAVNAPGGLRLPRDGIYGR